MILKDIETLNLVYSKQMAANRERMRSAIKRLRDRYFGECYTNINDIPVIVPKVEAWPGLQEN